MILIGVGANINSPFGTPRETLSHLPQLLATHGITVIQIAPLYDNAAWPDPSDPPFVNTVMQIETTLPPHDLLTALLNIERQCGRIRSHKNAPRPLDLDILDYNGLRINDDTLTLPHPHMLTRDFVMVPLKAIAGYNGLNQ